MSDVEWLSAKQSSIIMVKFGFWISKVSSDSNIFIALQGLEGEDENAALSLLSDNTAKLTSAMRYSRTTIYH